MNWLALILAFSIAAVTGAFFARLTASSRPAWTRQRRQWVAASILPCFILLLTVAGLAWVLIVGPGVGENMQDLALLATASIGAIFAVLALAGGLVGAALGSRL